MEKQSKNNTLIFIAAALALSMLFGLLYWKDNQIERLKDLINKQDTIINTKTDTLYKTIYLTDTLLQERQTTIIKIDTLYTNEGNTVTPKLKKKMYQDTLTNTNSQDTVKYQLSIEGYSMNDNDSLPKLNNISFELNKQTVIKEKEVIIEKYKKDKKWNISIGVGAGYGVLNKNPDVFIGLSIGYKIF